MPAQPQMSLSLVFQAPVLDGPGELGVPAAPALPLPPPVPQQCPPIPRHGSNHGPQPRHLDRISEVQIPLGTLWMRPQPASDP